MRELLILPYFLFLITLATPTISSELNCKNLFNIDFSYIADAPTKITGVRYIQAKNSLPAYCEIIGYTAPQVGIHLRLPDNWDKTFHMEGCGTLCGVRIIEKANDVLYLGGAVSTTDMGHSAPLATADWNNGTADYNTIMRSGLWAYNNINQEVDYAYRGTHKAVLASKVIIKEYYNTKINHSYFRGCSTGGRQGLIMAQRYPWHFDGIISGAPAGIDPDYINIFWRTLVNINSKGQAIVSQSKINYLHESIMKQCDGIDGLIDGVLSDPWACKPDLSEITCKNKEQKLCFLFDQISVIEKLYTGAFLSNNQRVSWGVPKGGELGLKRYILNEAGEVVKFEPLALDRLRFTWFDYDPGPNYNILDFNIDRDVPRLFTKGFLQAPNNPDLSDFYNNKNKLILYQGLNDMLNTEPLIDYVKKVKRIINNKNNVDNFIRLYLSPGMNHCRGGPGVDKFKWIKYIRDWVENNQSPKVVTGYKFKNNSIPLNKDSWSESKNLLIKRPIYNYPNTAHYKGEGDESFEINFHPKPLSY